MSPRETVGVLVGAPRPWVMTTRLALGMLNPAGRFSTFADADAVALIMPHNPPAPPPLPDSPPLQGERVAFTGTLASMTHRDARGIVEDNGGQFSAHVSRQLTMLVVGEEGWPLEADGQISQKLQHAFELQLAGCEIRVLKESEWLHLVGLAERQRDVHRLHTPATLGQLLDVPVAQIRRWERLGLIQAAKRVHRLPYFDYNEVAGARRLAELLNAGVSRAEIETNLARLKQWLPGIDRPLVQLDLLERDNRLVIRDEFGIIEPDTRQRLFDFEDQPAGEPSPADDDDEADILDFPDHLSTVDDRSGWTAEDWFAEGCRLSECASPSQAQEAFRMSLMLDPQQPEAHFHLAEALYRAGNRHGAVERYYVAVENDRDYIEAWTQLGCLLDELGQVDDAEDAFRIALQAHPDYADACFHLADVLWRTGRAPEALDLWRRYLEQNDRGLWADTARQRLEQASAPTLPE